MYELTRYYYITNVSDETSEYRAHFYKYLQRSCEIQLQIVLASLIHIIT